MSQVFIASEQLDASANKMMSLAMEVERLFQAISADMHGLTSYWNSPAQQALLARFETLSPAFTSYVSRLENYSQYLTQTAASYRQIEQSLTQAAKG